jgi:WD40 repeat protein
VYSTQQLLAGSTSALADLQLPQDVLQLAWRPGATAEFAALLADGSIELASLAISPTPIPLAAAAGMPATCLAWSPDGGRLAVGAGDEVAIYAPEQASDVLGNWQQGASMRVLSNEVQDDDQELLVRLFSAIVLQS